MARKNWIMLKRGLSADPKHREKIGMAIWCFMHIIDRADFETGKVFDWRDKDEAEDMGVNERTLRDWRQKLANEGYIECQQKQRGLEVTIFNWVNPREYSSGPINIKGDKITAPSEIQGDTQVDTPPDTQVSRQNVTPTYDSESRNQGSEKSPALNFSTMTPKDARQLPTLKLYADATEFFPGSVIWEFVHTFISDHKLTAEKIREAAISWTLAGYKRENVKGILEWALNGIPEKHQTKIVKVEPEQPYTNRWQPELEVETMQPGESYYTSDGVEHIYGG